MFLDPRSRLVEDPSRWRICVLLPTVNEEATLELVIGEIRESFSEHGLQDPVIIITDDSHDETRPLAHRLGVHVVIGGGKGLGYAMQRGLKAALSFKPDVITA